MSEFPEWGRERCIINNSRLMELSGIQKSLKQRIQRQIKYCEEGALYWLIVNTVEVAFPSVHFLFKYCIPTPPRRHFSRELSLSLSLSGLPREKNASSQFVTFVSPKKRNEEPQRGRGQWRERRARVVKSMDSGASLDSNLWLTLPAV